MIYPKFNSDYVKCSSTGQDGGIRMEQLRHSGAAVPEKQRVPRQKTGAKVWLSHQYWNLKSEKYNHFKFWVVSLLIFHFLLITFIIIINSENNCAA